MTTERKTIYILGLILLVFGVLLAGTQPAAAQDPQPTPSDNEVNRVDKQLYCPVCENIPLDVCPTQACAEWRELIRLRLSEGWTAQQIKDYFAAQYGDRVLAEPPRRGLNWLVYLLPPVFFMVGAVIVWRVLVSMRKKTVADRGVAAGSAGSRNAGTTNPAAQAGDEDIYLKKLEEELKKNE